MVYKFGIDEMKTKIDILREEFGFTVVGVRRSPSPDPVNTLGARRIRVRQVAETELAGVPGARDCLRIVGSETCSDCGQVFAPADQAGVVATSYPHHQCHDRIRPARLFDLVHPGVPGSCRQMSGERGQKAHVPVRLFEVAVPNRREFLQEAGSASHHFSAGQNSEFLLDNGIT